MITLAIAVLLAWGALAFGAVYDWAVLPLAGGVLAVAAWQYRPRRAPAGRKERGLRISPLAGAAALLLLAVAVQIVPLRAATLTAISPSAARFLSSFDIAFANGMAERHALSIDPALTLRAVGYLAFGMLWVAACTSALHRGLSVRQFARNVAVVGTVLALIGLAQKATFNGKLLWFWTPDYFASNAFGPFVNRNHFAGWMMLALTVTLGLAAGYVSRSDVGAGKTWRERLLWMGSPAASPVLVACAASFTMACALLWTMSRSGILAAGCAVTVLTGAVALRSGTGVHRVLTVASAVGTIALVVAWRGADTLFAWYGNTGTWQWRVQLWQDTLPALRDFWLTGSGLNTYGSLMLMLPRTDMTVQPLQAHNDYLQLAVEGGLLLLVPALVLIVLVARRIMRAVRMPQEPMTWWVRIGAIAGICGMAVQEISEFSLQIPGVALLFGACLALAMHEPAAPVVRASSRRGHLAS